MLHLDSGADTKAAKFFINCLAEQPEDVAKFLVPRIRQVCSSHLMPHSVMSILCLELADHTGCGLLQVPSDAGKLVGKLGSGADIRFLTKPLAYRRILARLLTRARKDRFVPEE